MTSDTSVRLCVPVCVRRARELRPSVERAARVADIIELRMDCLADDAELEEARHALAALSTARPLILTLRPATQGGGRELDFARRVQFWTENFATGDERADYADLELDLVAHLTVEEARRGRKLIDWDKVICSHHDFARVPADLETIFARMSATPARILKLAVQARDATDCLPVFDLLERARRAGRDMIAVAMGEAGLVTRLLAPARGAFLTFGALAPEQATAPGQTTARDMRDLYRVHLINEATQITGLVGSPVAHSVSPHMHNAAFAAHRLDAVYIPFETTDALSLIRRMAHPRTRELGWNLRGLSVTAPHKSAVMPLLDWLEPAARAIGAVNTVVVERDALRGYNTDAAAALAPLAGLVEVRGASVAVLGAGGAARAVLWSLRERGARTTVVFARDRERARATAGEFDAAWQALDPAARFHSFDLVINTTPLGTRGAHEAETPATSAQLRGARAAYDLVYNPGETRFMREAREAGCETILGGLPMLVAQAAAQFKLWTGRDAPVAVMHAAAKQRLESRD